jgi:hypothetical protein
MNTHSTTTNGRPSLRRLLGVVAALVAVVMLAAAPSVAGKLINTKDIAKGAVTTPKIAKKAVKAKSLADGSVRSAKIAPGAVTRAHLASDLQPLWAFVWGGPSINKGKGATAVSSVSDGNYKVTFDRDVSACAYTATLAAPTSVSPEQTGIISVSAFTADPAAVNVRTRALDGSPAARGFTVQVWC